MKAIALGVFMGGMLRVIFGMHSLNSTSMDTTRMLLGIVACILVLLTVSGIIKLLQSSGNTAENIEDIFIETTD